MKCNQIYADFDICYTVILSEWIMIKVWHGISFLIPSYLILKRFHIFNEYAIVSL